MTYKAAHEERINNLRLETIASAEYNGVETDFAREVKKRIKELQVAWSSESKFAEDCVIRMAKLPELNNGKVASDIAAATMYDALVKAGWTPPATEVAPDETHPQV